jgi:YVTN family beta-propeller protein
MNGDPSNSARPQNGATPYIAVGAKIGAYRIESYLDRGGMASVYEATDLRLNRHVALKVLGQELSEGPDFRERFMRESLFAASLDHPNIVPIYDAGEADGLLYIAMRFVRGHNLAEELKERGPLEPDNALAILRPVADALDAAHTAGLVHRDVKPANILLTTPSGRDGYQHVYLTDFGLTKRTSALTKLTATGHFIGTMAYISPEQIRGEPVDSLTDLYALGCVAYECLTGVPPFVRDDQAALLWAHLNDQPAALSAHRPALQAGDSVVARALAKRPQDRFQTCDQFIEILTEVLLNGRHRMSSLPTAESALPVFEPDPRVVEGVDQPVTGRSTAEDLSAANSATQALDQQKGLPPTGEPDQPPTAGPAERTGPAGPGGPPVETPGVEPAGPGGGTPSSPPGGPTDGFSGGHPSGPPRGPAGGGQGGPAGGGPGGPADGRSRTGGSGPRRRNRKTRWFVIAAVIVVMTTITSIFVIRSVSNRSSVTASLTDGALTSSAASSSAPLSPSSSARPPDISTLGSPSTVAEPATPAPAVPEAAAPTASIAPAAAVAIPTIDGLPIPVGPTPGFVTLTPNGRLAYIANRDAGYVTVLDTTVNKVIAQIHVPAGPPQYIAFTPDGNHAYVSVYNQDKTINLVAVLDTRTTKLDLTIPVEQKPYALAVTPDQRFVYVPSHDAGAIDVIDVATNTVVQKVPVLPNPHWVTFTGDGKLAYIADHESNVLTVLDVATNTQLQTIPVGTSPHSVAISPDGKQVAVVCFTSNDIYFIDSATNQVIGSTPIGTNPQDVTYSPDGHYLYTANVADNTVSVIDTETRAVTATIPTDSPSSIAVHPDGRHAYVTNLNTGTLTLLNISQ